MRRSRCCFLAGFRKHGIFVAVHMETACLAELHHSTAPFGCCASPLARHAVLEHFTKSINRLSTSSTRCQRTLLRRLVPALISRSTTPNGLTRDATRSRILNSATVQRSLLQAITLLQDQVSRYLQYPGAYICFVLQKGLGLLHHVPCCDGSTLHLGKVDCDHLSGSVQAFYMKCRYCECGILQSLVVFQANTWWWTSGSTQN